ncbi:MAG: hypothetical protein V4582_05810 [Pseudomonadota bacterium]
MEKLDDHILQLDKKITGLSDALAHLGQGSSLKELVKVIRFPGYTTPAELALSHLILDGMQAQVGALARMESELLAASKRIVEQHAHTK